LAAGRIPKKMENHQKEKVIKFVEKYLNPDGSFVLQLVDYNTDVVTANEFIVSLWDKYKSKPQEGYIEPTTSLKDKETAF